MKPWEVKKTRKKLKNLSGEAAWKIFFDLYFSARKILWQSLKNENPNLPPKKIKNLFNKHLKVASEL
jgi:hypothetical protein